MDDNKALVYVSGIAPNSRWYVESDSFRFLLADARTADDARHLAKFVFPNMNVEVFKGYHPHEKPFSGEIAIKVNKPARDL